MSNSKANQQAVLSLNQNGFGCVDCVIQEFYEKEQNEI